MSDQTHGHEMLKRRDREMIPTRLLIAMGALALSALALTTYARVTDRPLVGVPHAAEVTDSRVLILDGNRYGEVIVRDADGAVLMELDASEAGFISVIWRGLDRKRMLMGTDPLAPVNLVEYANGRLSIQDPATGWSAEIASFGALNEAAFAKLLD
ncbi:MAG: photosynthetic complex assembly protein PuhC [Pseudomonadota bacterium]